MTLSSNHDTEILILGAGMAGLSAATELQRAGRRVLHLGGRAQPSHSGAKDQKLCVVVRGECHRRTVCREAGWK